jgi:hypothetical protein
MSFSSFLHQIPTWILNVYYVETCNCNYECPCNFNGFCRTLVLFHIRSGKYDGTNHHGINMICAFSWPKTIYEGNEMLSYLLQKKFRRETIYTNTTSKGFYLEACRGCKKVIRITTRYLNFDHSCKNASCSVIECKGP